MRWILTADATKEKQVASQLRPRSAFYRFLWEIRAELFEEGFEDELTGSYQPRGQEPCPPALLAMVMLLQRYEGVSDAAAVDAAENDRRWQLVLGTLGGDGAAPFGQGTLVRFRVRMIANDLDKKLLERTVALAKKTGKFGWQKLRVALDSSPLEGAGRVEDTWNLIGRAMSKVVHIVSSLVSVDQAEIIQDAKLTLLDADSIKAALDIDWDDDHSRASALKRVLREVDQLEAWVAKRAKAESSEPPLKGALDQLRRVVGQDIEPDPSGGGPRIKRGVARDRMISIGDPEMRHGRKSKTKRFNGYKRHIAVANGLVLGAAVEPANHPEHRPAARLLAAVAAYGDIAILDIDRGYLSSPAVEALHENGVLVNSRAWAGTNMTGHFPKKAFNIDVRGGRVVCPAKKVAMIPASGVAVFAPEECGACSLKASCTAAESRTISVHRQEGLLVQLRRRAGTRSGRSELRQRVVVEHRLARVGFIQGRRARYRGARKNELDLNRAGAVANLQEVARLRAA